MEGSGNIVMEDQFNADNFHVVLKGSGDITVNVNAVQIKSELMGSWGI